MTQPKTQMHFIKILLFHLPLISVLLVISFFELIGTPFFERFRNEETFGWMLVVWIPVGILLSLGQVFLWLHWFVRKATLQIKKKVRIGFLIILAIYLGLFLLRNLQ